MSNSTAITQEVAEETLARFSRLILSVEEFANVQGGRKDGFRDMTDQDTPDETSSIRTLASQAGQLVRGTCEHLLAFIRCTQEPRLTIAPYACVRAALEASAIAVWITDQRVDRTERIARSFAFRFEGMTQQIKSADPNDPAQKTALEGRIAQIDAKAVAMGYGPFRDKTGTKISKIGTQWPGSVGTVIEALDMEKEYRLLSAVAHAHPWAVTQVSYRPSEQAELHELHLHPTALQWLCQTGAQSLAAAVWNASEFLNTETATTQNLLDSLYDGLAMTLPRFWR